MHSAMTDTDGHGGMTTKALDPQIFVEQLNDDAVQSLLMNLLWVLRRTMRDR